MPYLPLSGATVRTARIAEYLNTRIANNPAPIQQYIFASIAHDIGCSVDEVRNFLSNGGYNGITIRVDEEARWRLSGYKTKGNTP
jgi:hypothetical protein